MNRLKESFVASPPMRSNYVRDVPVSPSSSKINIRAKSGIQLGTIGEQFRWLLRTLWEDGNNLFLARLPLVVDELDRLLKAEPKVAEMISSYNAGLIGDLSIVAECLRQLDIYQPWSNGFESAMIDKEDAIKEFSRDFQAETTILETMRDENLVTRKAMEDPTDKKFEYPVSKRHNRANVEKLRTAEANLDIFWALIDGILYAKTDNLHSTALREILFQPRALQRTPEWAEPEPEPKTKTKSDTKEAEPNFAQPNMLYKPFSGLSIGTSARKEALNTANATKAKVKPQRTPSSVTPLNEPRESASSPEDLQPAFEVDARALKVFLVVFFNPDANTTPGEVAWNDFLHAMASAGFGAQKLYGSSGTSSP